MSHFAIQIGGEYGDGTLATCEALSKAFLNNSNVPGGDDTEGNACGE